LLLRRDRAVNPLSGHEKLALCALHKRSHSHARKLRAMILLYFPSILLAESLAKYVLALADRGGFQHIAAARYRDLRLRGRRPSWAFPP
jgi:hypothetical protein